MQNQYLKTFFIPFHIKEGVEMKEEKTVFPGTELAEEEEFLPGANTFVENGHVLSDSVGEKEIDLKERKVGVHKNKKIIKPKVNDLVYGLIVQVKNSFAIIDIWAINNHKIRQFFKYYYAILPVANVSQTYVEDLRDLLKKGDFIKAKIDKIDKFGIKVKIKGYDLGVILGHCSKCRAPLVLSNNRLKCKRCLNEEKRKIAYDSYLLKL